jgi:hypothetical protein
VYELVAPIHAVATPALDRRWSAERFIREFRKDFGGRNPPPGSTFRVHPLVPGGYDRLFRYEGRGCGWVEMLVRRLSSRGRPLKGKPRRPRMFVLT